MKKAIITFITIFFVQIGFSQQDEDFKKDALKVLELSGAIIQLQSTKHQLTKMVPKDKQKEFTADFENSLPVVYEKFAKMYMKLYTKEELKTIIAFYETPIGKKMKANTEEVAIKSQAISQEWMVELNEILNKYRLP